MTDHRAEAEKWLTEATDIWNEPRDYDDPPVDQLRIISRALVGIGYALLGLVGTPPGTFTIRPGLTTAVTTSRPATPTESRRCGARHGDLRCVFWAGHKDPHRGTWTGEPEEDVSA